MPAELAAIGVVPSKLIMLVAMLPLWLVLVVTVLKISHRAGKLVIGFAPGPDVVDTTMQAGQSASNAEHQEIVVQHFEARRRLKTEIFYAVYICRRCWCIFSRLV
ncbi:hypothetical protein Dimus_034404 [Dionaea muscipula]